MWQVHPIDQITGEISVPGDKSISHRGVMLGAISRGKTKVTGFLPGEDCISTINCFRQLGVEIQQEGDQVLVQGRGTNGLLEAEDVLDAGNSGTTMRLMSGILAGQPFLSVVTGDSSLRSRPMGRVMTPLKQMGATLTGRAQGKLAPLVIQGGNLQGIDYTLPVSSAQVKSAILLAGLYAAGTTVVREPVQTRDHSERMLKAFGANLQTEPGIVTVQASQLEGQELTVPGDISSAAFFLVAAAAKKNSSLRIKGVGLNPTRTGILDVLKAMGAQIETDRVHISGGEEIGDLIVTGKALQGTEIKGALIPRLIDEIPVIAVGAALAEGQTVITGAEELRHKESDRITATVTELKKLGIQAAELPDGMVIQGGFPILGGHVNSYGDHRIAMALAVAGLFAKEPVSIDNSRCIDISFPGFAGLLKQISK